MKNLYIKAGFKTLNEALLLVSKNGILKALRWTGPDELVYLETNFKDPEADKFLETLN